MRKPKPLADLLDACLAPSLAAQGFAASDILAAWPEIVGSRLANVTQPQRIEWKRRTLPADLEKRPEPATLVVRVESAFALELQHLAPVVIERVNSHFGWRCIGRLVLKQGPVRTETAPARPRPAPTEDDLRAVDAAIASVADDPLREALSRLGAAILGSQRSRPPTKA
jgi:hypothetical protein